MAMGMRRRRRSHSLNAEVNVINLVDVMLVLLIIFMVTAPVLQGGLPIKLPRADARAAAESDAVTVTILSSGSVEIGDHQYSFAQFRTAFPILVAAKHPTSVSVRGDARAPYGDIVRVMDEVRRAGIDKLNIMTDPTSQ